MTFWHFYLALNTTYYRILSQDRSWQIMNTSYGKIAYSSWKWISNHLLLKIPFYVRTLSINLLKRFFSRLFQKFCRISILMELLPIFRWRPRPSEAVFWTSVCKSWIWCGFLPGYLQLCIQLLTYNIISEIVFTEYVQYFKHENLFLVLIHVCHFHHQ